VCVAFLQPNEANFGSLVTVLLGSLLRISSHHYVSFYAINTIIFERSVSVMNQLNDHPDFTFII